MCYSADAKLTTRCGHSFCFGCVKRWIVASDEEGKPSCPMCRTTLHFKGIQKIQYALAEERYQRACSEVLDDVITNVFENQQLSTSVMPDFEPVFQRMALAALKEDEETMRVMKDIDGAAPILIAQVIESGQVLKYKNELRFVRSYEWKQRDRFAAKHERTRVMSRHR